MSDALILSNLLKINLETGAPNLKRENQQLRLRSFLD
jgi:hypothetical protein